MTRHDVLLLVDFDMVQSDIFTVNRLQVDFDVKNGRLRWTGLVERQQLSGVPA